jgi:hypothetical protein
VGAAQHGRARPGGAIPAAQFVEARGGTTPGAALPRWHDGSAGGVTVHVAGAGDGVIVVALPL